MEWWSGGVMEWWSDGVVEEDRFRISEGGLRIGMTVVRSAGATGERGAEGESDGEYRISNKELRTRKEKWWRIRQGAGRQCRRWRMVD